MSRDTLASGTSARYISLPAAGTAGSPAADGAALDAGTAMIVSNNWNHLRNESLRTLVSDHWGQTASAGYNDWSGINEEVPPAALRDASVQGIDWSRNNCARYGPLPLLRDAIGVTPGRDGDPRRIKVSVYARTTATLDVYVAFTTGDTPDRGTLAFSVLTTTSSTLTELTDTYDVGLGAVTERLCGTATDAGPGTVDVEEVYLYVGYKQSSGSLAIASITAYEVPT